MATEIHATYWEYHKGYGKYKAQLWAKVDGKALGVIATGTFPSKEAVLKWARDWAKSKRAKLTTETWR